MPDINSCFLMRPVGPSQDQRGINLCNLFVHPHVGTLQGFHYATASGSVSVAVLYVQRRLIGPHVTPEHMLPTQA